MPRETITTTMGDVRDGPLDELLSDMLQILNGDIPDNGMLCFICRLDNIKEIDDRMSVSPRFIDLILPEGGEITCNERPLRAETAMGPRVSLAKSEQVPEGTTCEFTIHTQTKEGMRMVIDCLEYGEERGTGQWRNAGNGCFTFEVLALDKETFKSKHQDAYDKLKEL